MKTKILLALAVLLGAIQAIRPAKNLSAAEPFTGKNEITVLHPASPEVRQILAASCYDCHSNTTHYPWYAEVQPVGWWLAKHVKDGRRHLNFSEFGTYTTKRQMKKLEEVCDEVKDHGMPLKSYTLVHDDARLTAPQAAALIQWAEAAQDKIAEK
jgi:hypothetical protein